MKKLISLSLAILMILSGFTPVFAENNISKNENATIVKQNEVDDKNNVNNNADSEEEIENEFSSSEIIENNSIIENINEELFMEEASTDEVNLLENIESSNKIFANEIINPMNFDTRGGVNNNEPRIVEYGYDKNGEVYSSESKVGTYSIVVPAKLYESGKQYKWVIADEDIVDSFASITNPQNLKIEIQEFGTSNIVGEAKTEYKDNKLYLIYDFTNLGSSNQNFHVKQYSFELKTKDNVDKQRYIFLPGLGNNTYTINYVNFIPKIEKSGDTYIATVEPVEGYATGNVKATIRYNMRPGYGKVQQKGSSISDGNEIELGDTITLASGAVFSEFNIRFELEGTTLTKYSDWLQLGTQPAPPVNHSTSMILSAKEDRTNNELKVCITINKGDGAPELPETINLESLTITHRVTSGTINDVPEENLLKLNDGRLELIDTDLHSGYKLKETITLNESSNTDKSKTYELNIGVENFVTSGLVDNTWVYARCSFMYKQDGVNEVEVKHEPYDIIHYNTKGYEYKHKAIVIEEKDGSFIVESFSLIPVGMGDEPVKPTEVVLSNYELLWPADVSEDNKFEIDDSNFIKKANGYAYNGSLEISDGDLKEVKNKDTGKLESWVYTRKTKLSEMPTNLHEYTGDKEGKKAIAKGKVDYKITGIQRFFEHNSTISFLKPMVDKYQIGQRVEGRDRINTWAIVVNRDHKTKALTKIEDFTKNSTLVDDTLKYYFVPFNPNPDQQIPKDDPQKVKEFINALTGENTVYNDLNSQKPYYIREDNPGNNKFTIYFGDHSSKLNDVINKINSEVSDLETKNSEIIKLIFKDYVFMENPLEHQLYSNGSYFDTNDVYGKRHFPALSIFANGLEVEPFTSLVDNYVTMKRTVVPTSDQQGKYEMIKPEENNEKGDALILVYETRTTGNTSENDYRVHYFNKYPPFTITEAFLGDTDAYPQLFVGTVPANTEGGGESEEIIAEGVYTAKKHSFVDSNDSTQIHSGILANMNGAYLENISIEDTAKIDLGKAWTLNQSFMKVYEIPLATFEESINALTASGLDEDTAKKQYIENFADNPQGSLISKSVEIKHTEKQNFAKINFAGKTDHVYLYLYSTDYDYFFEKNGTELKNTIDNVATINYNNGKYVNQVTSQVEIPSFATKGDITDTMTPVPENHTGEKRYKIELDLSKLNISTSATQFVIKEKVLDGAKDITDYVTFSNLNVTDANLTISKEGSNFIVKKTDETIPFANTIEVTYDAKFNIANIFGGSDGTDKTVLNTAEILFESKNPNTTITQITTAESKLEFGQYIEKTVEEVSPDQLGDSKRDYTVSIDLSGKEKLKSLDFFLVRDVVKDYHSFTTYRADSFKVVDDENKEISNLLVRTETNSTKELIVKIYKVDNTIDFPNKLNLKYSVDFDIYGIFGSEVNQVKDIENTATTIFELDGNKLMQSDEATTQVSSKNIIAEKASFKVVVNKELQLRKDKESEAPNYEGISFLLQGKYKDGGETKDYSKELKLTKTSSDAVFTNVPIDGSYTITEKIDYKLRGYTDVNDFIKDYAYDEKNIAKFTISADGKVINNIEGFDSDFVKITGYRTLTDGLTSYSTGDIEPNDTIQALNIKYHNKLEPVENHTIHFLKVDDYGKPVKGAEFTLYKYEGTEYAQTDMVATSNDKGIVTFKNLENGRYKVKETKVPPRHEAGANKEFEFELTINHSAEFRLPTVVTNKLNKNHDISLKKVGEKGEGLVGAEFELQKPHRDGWIFADKTAVSNDEGLVVFEDIAPGTYRIVETKAPVNYKLSKDISERSYEITLEALASDNAYLYETTNKSIENKLLRHKITLTKVGETYKDEDKPLRGATFILEEFVTGGWIEAVDSDGIVIKAVSDKNGKVEFNNIPNGQYRIKESAADEDQLDDFVHNNSYVEVEDLSSATEEQTIEIHEHFRNEKYRQTIEFTKINENKEALLDVEFKLYRKVNDAFESEAYAEARSDADGKVVFENVENGIYKLVETKYPGYDKLDDIIITVTKEGVELPDDFKDSILINRMTRLNVEFKKIDSVTGRPLSGAIFKLQISNGTGYIDIAPEIKSTSDANGIVKFTNLLSGDYRAVEIAAPRGYILEEKTVEFSLDDKSSDLKLEDVTNERQPGPSIITIPCVTGGCEDKYLLNKKDHYAYLYGYPDGSFGPKRNMTRAEVTAMFGRLLLKQPHDLDVYEQYFNDVYGYDWYASAVTMMVRYDLIKGYPDGSFRPNNPISRAEFAAIASRFEKLAQGHANFSDVSKDYWAYGAIASAYNKGWVKGYPDGTFRPHNFITREEVVAVTNRMLDRKCDLDFVEKHIHELVMFFDNPKNAWSYGDVIEATNGHDYHRKNNNSIEEIWERLNGKEFRI